MKHKTIAVIALLIGLIIGFWLGIAENIERASPRIESLERQIETLENAD